MRAELGGLGDRLQKIGNSRRWLFFALLTSIVAVSSIDLLYATTRLRRLSPDSFNYLTVARNIVVGRGISQSAIGFNDERSEEALSRGIQALTAQPPLYPILTAALSSVGLNLESAGLLVTRAGFVLAVLAGVRLAIDMGGAPVCGWLAGAVLLWNPALRDAALRPQSDGLGTGILMMGLSCLLFREQLVRFRSGLALGLLLGTAFATRYILGVVLILAFHRLRGTSARLRAGLALGFSLPAGLVTLHNLRATGRAFGVGRLPSDRGWAQNALDASLALVAKGPGDTDALWTGVSVAVVGLLMMRASSIGWTPFEWPVLYVSALVALRSTSHFAPLDGRLLLPASVPLLIIGACSLKRTPVQLGLLAFVASSVFASARGVEAYQASEPSSFRKDIRSSEKLIWVRDVPQPDDLLVGDDAVDLGYYFDRTVLSVSPFPYTRRLDWPEICGFASTWKRDRPGAQAYVVMNRRSLSPQRWEESFGSVFGALANGQRDRATIVARLNDAWVYRLDCETRAAP